MYTFIQNLIKRLSNALGNVFGRLILWLLDVIVPVLFKPLPPRLQGATPIAEAIAHDYIVKKTIDHNRRMCRLIGYWLGAFVLIALLWLVLKLKE